MRQSREVLFVGVGVALLLAGFVLPSWLMFLFTNALAKSMVVLGVILLMRAGLVSFGQALFFAGGAYASGFVVRLWEVREVAVHLAAGLLVGSVLAIMVGALVARYREIFFAMLTLALSMVLWGILVRARDITGGTDGLQVGRPHSLLGLSIADGPDTWLYVTAVVVVIAAFYLTFRMGEAPLGYLAQAIRDNEIRVGYLGGSVERVVFVTFVWAGALSGIAGSIQALNVAHIDPTTAFWTTSGEFVFVALIAGSGRLLAPLFGTLVFEVARSYITAWYPELWQLVLGVVLLLIVLFLPEGLWSLTHRAGWRRKQA